MRRLPEFLPNGKEKDVPSRDEGDGEFGQIFLRASERTTAVATSEPPASPYAIMRRSSPLPRREQWARHGRSLESLTPRPGIREQYLPSRDFHAPQQIAKPIRSPRSA